MAETRERSRSVATQPIEELEDADEQVGDGALKRAAATLAAGALAAGIAAATKVLLERRASDGEANDARQDEEEPQDQGVEEPQDQAVDEPQDEDLEEPQDQDLQEPQDKDVEEPQDQGVEEPQDQTEPEPEKADEPDEAVEQERDEPENQQAAPTGEISAIISRARNQLQGLLGSEPESVSAIERSNGNWAVMFEVVEMRRVPDSTDVLSSYEVVLDDEGNVVRMVRTRRYLRSQVEEMR